MCEIWDFFRMLKNTVVARTIHNLQYVHIKKKEILGWVDGEKKRVRLGLETGDFSENRAERIKK